MVIRFWALQNCIAQFWIPELHLLQSQKNIAANRNKYLVNEKKITQQKILINNLKKNKAEEKTLEYKKSYNVELESKNNK